MAQLLGVLSIGLGLLLLVLLIQVFAVGGWKEGAICVGSVICAYVIWGTGLPVLFPDSVAGIHLKLLSPESIADYSSSWMQQVMAFSQLTALLSYATGLATLAYLSRERRADAAASRRATASARQATPPAAPPVRKVSQFAGTPLVCPECRLQWTAPPDECPRCATNESGS